MNKKKLAATISVLGFLAAGTALAGEVKGPPGAGNVRPKDVTHANSICSFSGLNDYVNGPADFIAQTFGIDVHLYDADPREGGPGDACRGGSNPYNP